jgi:adenine-specific DNA-methyltransferase
LYFNEINEMRIKNLKKYFGAGINITIKDFLTFDDRDKYSLVVSNPPYAKFNGSERTSKNHNLARAFIKKALDITEDGGYILFIVPNNWMSLSDRNILPRELTKYQFIHVNIHWAKKRFPGVGSSFTWFLLRKTPNEKPFVVENNYVLKDTQRVKIGASQDFVPLYLSRDVLNILNKTVNNSSLPKYAIQTTSDLHRTTKKDLISDKRSGKFCNRVIHTPSQTVRSKRKHKFQEGRKVFISLTNQYGTFIDNCGMTQSIAFVRCESRKEAENVKRDLDAEVFRFINNITRYWNFNNIRVLQRLPLLEHIHLSAAETNFVYNFNKAYYGKKEK